MSMIGYSVINTKGQVTIPATIRKLLGVKTGGKVVVAHTADSIIIKQVANIFSLRGSVVPKSQPENFPLMRKKFTNYLSSRKTT